MPSEPDIPQRPCDKDPIASPPLQHEPIILDTVDAESDACHIGIGWLKGPCEMEAAYRNRLKQPQPNICRSFRLIYPGGSDVAFDMTLERIDSIYPGNAARRVRVFHLGSPRGGGRQRRGRPSPCRPGKQGYHDSRQYKARHAHHLPPGPLHVTVPTAHPSAVCCAA